MPIEEYLKILLCIALVIVSVSVLTIPISLLLVRYDEQLGKLINKIKNKFRRKK